MYLKARPYEGKWIIVELVAQIRAQGVITSRIGLGWNIIDIFHSVKTLADIHPNQNDPVASQLESKPTTLNLFQGSPAYLLSSQELVNIETNVTAMTYRTFSFRVFALSFFTFLFNPPF